MGLCSLLLVDDYTFQCLSFLCSLDCGKAGGKDESQERLPEVGGCAVESPRELFEVLESIEVVATKVQEKKLQLA